MLSRGALPKDEPEEPFKATAAGHTLEAHYSIIFHSTINAPRDATKIFSMSCTKQASPFSFLCFFSFSFIGSSSFFGVQPNQLEVMNLNFSTF